MSERSERSETYENSDYLKIPQLNRRSKGFSSDEPQREPSDESRCEALRDDKKDLSGEDLKYDVKHDVMKKREELIRLSEDGEISQSVQNLKKASDKVILKIYSEYEIKQAEKANVFLTDLLISKFADLLGGLEAIESSEELEKELVKDKLLKRDVKSVVEKLSPYLPYLGILSGGITVGKHVIKKQTGGSSEPLTSD